MGSLVSSVAVPSPAAVVGSVWSGAARPAAASANQRKLRTGKGTCMKEATARGVPISSTMRSMSLSVSRSIRSASRCSSRLRSRAGTVLHGPPAKARAAAATASSAWAVVRPGTTASTSSVAGLITSNGSPSPVTQRPSMYARAGRTPAPDVPCGASV